MTTSLYDLTPGTRVVVHHAGHLNRRTGVVVEMAEKLLNGHDAAVQLDPADDGGQSEGGALCFYAHELAVAK